MALGAPRSSLLILDPLEEWGKECFVGTTNWLASVPAFTPTLRLHEAYLTIEVPYVGKPQPMESRLSVTGEAPAHDSAGRSGPVD